MYEKRLKENYREIIREKYYNNYNIAIISHW